MTAITIDRAVVEQALETWQSHQHGKCSLEKVVERFDTLRAAIKAAEGEKK